jgi:hypothetical protein
MKSKPGTLDRHQAIRSSRFHCGGFWQVHSFDNTAKPFLLEGNCQRGMLAGALFDKPGMI